MTHAIQSNLVKLGGDLVRAAVLTKNPRINTFQRFNWGHVRRLTTMSSQVPLSSDFLFRQMFDPTSCTYTYLLADTESKEAVLIDPVLEQVDRDAGVVRDLGLSLKFVRTGLLKKKVPGCKSLISEASGAMADVHVLPGEEVKFGQHKLEVRPTPGHTSGCVTYVCHEQGIAFTGDTILIRGCGRTDFQEGDPAVLYKSVNEQIFSLPDNFKLYPAHDYKGLMVTTVEEEKKLNPRLTKSLDQFIEIMNNLNLPYPKKIDVAVPANRVCGIQDDN